jgi:hypothetical protein
MLRYLWHLLFGDKLCVACHQHSAAAKSLCLYCEIKRRLIQRVA